MCTICERVRGDPHASEGQWHLPSSANRCGLIDDHRTVIEGALWGLGVMSVFDFAYIRYAEPVPQDPSILTLTECAPCKRNWLSSPLLTQYTVLSCMVVRNRITYNYICLSCQFFWDALVSWRRNQSWNWSLARLTLRNHRSFRVCSFEVIIDFPLALNALRRPKHTLWLRNIGCDFDWTWQVRRSPQEVLQRKDDPLTTFPDKDIHDLPTGL
jgi:hypothetical protein